ncbi:prepilin-type N-terminal cleavage/methylation domain-containing protein [Luteolibacter sp. GHJ8]|uniref:Prepilin-type N-terminal cleavage/methylation domain-containing protein n=1 Tax=Luteolibacter rhizosphaerae TaxID=2989719 RepID=A0ABT3G6J8_9BACT|nr:prepilin-type N-terminal cleavage/methylation domain-containing protein [Luteolibacter rhizosphaerae]MCW1915478.1 prepilin-type N-terminal cleavage/methylation domain-containing protein [Luteolibacter rhizosphaerae]
MKSTFNRMRRGFTLMETVIAIGVLALLLTAFLAVFGPATTGLRKAISVQEADRLAAALERELVTLRPGTTTEYKTGFDKAYQWIEEASSDADASIFLYQYRGTPNEIREDGSMEPFTQGGGVAGKDFIVQPSVRKRDDPLFLEDLEALDGRIFTTKLTQLEFANGQLVKREDEGINNDPNGTDESLGGTGSDAYVEAVIAFAAEFFIVPNSDPNYVRPGGKFNPENLTKPVFTRNLAVRR